MKKGKKKASQPSTAPSFAQFAARMRPDNPLMAEFASFVRNSRSQDDLDTWRAVRRYLQRLGASDVVLIGGRLAWREFQNKTTAQARN
jgi:hypothetical protein